MKNFYSLVFLGFSFLLMSCNGIGSKDTIVARIGSETLYAEDLDFLTLQHAGKTATEKYKSATDKLMFSLAKLSKLSKETLSYDSAWVAYEPVVSNRLLTIAYTQFHLGGRLGYTDEELKNYFEEHRNEFDSSASYWGIRGEIADRYYLSKNQDSLKKYIKEHLVEKDEPAKADLLFFTGDSVAVAEMEGKLKAGVGEDSLSGIRHVVVVQGQEKDVFADSSLIKALFLTDPLAVGAIQNFRVGGDSSATNLVLKVKSRTAAKKAREEDFVKEFERAFVSQYRQSISKMIGDLANGDSSIVIEKISPKDPHKFYEDNIDKFMMAPSYEVYHVAMKDSAVLAKTMANVKDLESFKAVASTISENEETSENNGFVGRVKKDFALPYGIGMMPALWNELEGKKEGYISSAVRSGSDNLYHSFYVSAVIPAQPKSFDRVEKYLGEIYASDIDAIDPSTVLVSKGGTPLYTQADLMKIFNAEQGMPHKREVHRNIVNVLAQSYAIAEKAKQEKVDRSWEFRALLRSARLEFIMNRYDSVMKMTELEDLSSSEHLKKYLYFRDKEISYADQSYEEAEPNIVSILKSRAVRNAKTLFNMDVWNKTNVFFYDRSKAGLAPVTTAEGFLALGDSAAKDQKFKAAISAYDQVIELFALQDSLFRVAVYNMAQITSDAQKYRQSAANFEAFFQIWPGAPEAEKAMFSLGFILSENLKENDRALVVLEDFQKRFPKSELKESVDWLVENIKSDGKLADDLMKKIEAEE